MALGGESAGSLAEKLGLAEIEPRPMVTTMLRVVQQNHAQLSAMADQKANIVLGTSVLGLTVLLGRFQQSGLTPSLAILLLFILASAFFALMTVMPSLPKSVQVDASSPDFNPLFFGFFSAMEPEAYMTHMRDLMRDEGRVYEAILRDIHQAGCVLYREKYRYLAYSYRLLLAGFTLAILAALIEWLLASRVAA